MEGDAVIRDPETGRALTQKLNFGRPNWDREFAAIKAAHLGKDIGVFFCGPKIISSQLHECSNKFTAGDTRFFYHKVLRSLFFDLFIFWLNFFFFAGKLLNRSRNTYISRFC
jgi:hypothetical protein